MHNARMLRLDANRVQINNPQHIPITLFANKDVPVEQKAILELMDLLELQSTVERFYEVQPDAFDVQPSITRMALTPDFHKAQGIPVGTVLQSHGFLVPQAIGGDINCGMRLHTTSLRAEQITNHLDHLETALRSLFFEAGRAIPMTHTQRQAMLTEGLQGLLEATPKTLNEGQWSRFQRLDMGADLQRIERQGSIAAQSVLDLDDLLGPTQGYSRDAHIGSIGGGNHFVEVQRIERILDKNIAHAWGLQLGMVTVMVHSGSLGVGGAAGAFSRQVLREVYPKELQHPKNKIFVLPTSERHAANNKVFWNVLANAANFAFANRLFLAIMAMDGLERVLGDFEAQLLYDSPHNLVWPSENEQQYLHRKGATSAQGFDTMQNTPFAFYGEPVIVPGSMGSSSFVFAGNGLNEALSSASHGAGRALGRGEAMRGHEKSHEDFMKHVCVVTPLDFRRSEVRHRRDILKQKFLELKQEGPHAYKNIGPVVQTIADAGMARPVIELKPLITVKG